MTIIQSLIASIGGEGAPPPPPPPSNNDFFWAGDQDFWMAFGGIQGNSVFSNPAPGNPAYTYPDGSYTGKTRNFSGSEWMISTNLGIGNAWGNANAISINMWFWPTANNIQLLSELGAQDPSSGYHYTILEIDSGGYIRARFWNSAGTQAITSNNTVILNQWNHVYFAEDTQGGHIFELNGIATNSQTYYTRQSPGATQEYFAVGISDITSMVTNNPFQGKIGYLTISDYVKGSTYAGEVSRFKPPYINTGITLGTSWTIEIVAELNPTQYWATLWGNENYNAGLGHFAYFNGPTSLNVGSIAGQNNYNVTDIGTKSYWAFTHQDGDAISLYRNGVLVNPNVTGYVQPFPAGNTLLIGARHQNSGAGATDLLPGTYYYTNVNNSTALDATAILASYNSIKGTYGLP